MKSLRQRKRKSLRSDLLGLRLEEAENRLCKEGQNWAARRYVSYKPYETPDSFRVLRVKEKDDGFELLIGEFITMAETSQD